MRVVLLSLFQQGSGRVLPVGIHLHSKNAITKLESSSNEYMAGSAFIYTSESWGNIQQTDCQPNAQYLNAPLRIMGPFAAGTNITYQRSISFHQYLVLRFELIKMGWDNTSSLTISLLDQGNNVVSSQNIGNTPTVAQCKK
jgi:hypothetical protein